MTQIDLKNSARALMAEKRRQINQDSEVSHPDPDQLLAFQQQRLGDDARQEILAHLAICPQCTQCILDFARFPHLEPPEASQKLEPEDLEEWWLRFQQRIDSVAAPTGSATEEAPDLPPPTPRRWQRSLPVAWATAALFCLTTVGLLLNPPSPQGDRAPRHANVNFLSASLAPQGTTTVRSSPKPYRLAAYHGGLNVYLTCEDERRFSRWSLEAQSVEAYGVGDNNPPAQWAQDLQRMSDGHFTFSIQRDELRDGKYELTLYGEQGDHQEEIHRYRLEVRLEP